MTRSYSGTSWFPRQQQQWLPDLLQEVPGFLKLGAAGPHRDVPADHRTASGVNSSMLSSRRLPRSGRLTLGQNADPSSGEWSSCSTARYRATHLVEVDAQPHLNLTAGWADFPVDHGGVAYDRQDVGPFLAVAGDHVIDGATGRGAHRADIFEQLPGARSPLRHPGADAAAACPAC